MNEALWPDLEGRRVLLAVSGGVAAYKAAELCRLLVRCGATVQVMMTDAALRFVGEQTFAALSGRQVACSLFDPAREAQIGHIDLADRAELLVAAPATADLLARFAGGIADDLVTTVYLAYRGPVVLAPAMNVQMWEHPATRDNMIRLRERGHRVIGPASGEMACGHVGAGRMEQPEEILQAIGAALSSQDLAGRRVLVTAGPTRERIDPVRYLTNASSGKMGYALAQEALARGAEVVLVSGPTLLPTPRGARCLKVESAAEMAHAVREEVDGCDAVVMTAAVADYRPRDVARAKLKKEELGGQLVVELERTEDILAMLGTASAAGAGAGSAEPGAGGARRPLLVGFAAETSADLDEPARRKLRDKACDLLVANDVSAGDSGFAGDTNRVVLYGRDGAREPLPLLSKRRAAKSITDRMVAMLEGSDGAR